MIRSAVAGIIGVVAKIFFRRIEIAGVERIPADQPVIFAVNHPNALIDPLFLLCFAPRRVSVLAKAPLLKMPVIADFLQGPFAIDLLFQSSQRFIDRFAFF